MSLAPRPPLQPPLRKTVLLRQQALYDGARHREIHLAGIALFERGHDFTHILWRNRSDLLDQGADRGLRLVSCHLPWQVGRDDLYLLALFLGKLFPPSLEIELDGLLALLDHFFKQREQVLIRQRILTLATRLDIGILEPGIDQAKGRDSAF